MSSPTERAAAGGGAAARPEPPAGHPDVAGQDPLELGVFGRIAMVHQIAGRDDRRWPRLKFMNRPQHLTQALDDLGLSPDDPSLAGLVGGMKGLL